MIAETVKIKMDSITTTQPTSAIGRLKIFRSGLRSMNGKAAKNSMKAPGRATAPRNCPNSPAKIFSRSN